MPQGERVRVARNLHKKKLSIRGRDGKVSGYTDFIKLADVKFKVSKAGRERCLREGRKNVHAFAEGRIANDESIMSCKEVVEVSYNPYTMGSFYRKDTNVPVSAAEYLVIFPSGRMQAFNVQEGGLECC